MAVLPRMRPHSAAAVACAVLLAGCGALVPGRPVPLAPTVVTRPVQAELSTLLLDPGQFPAPYEAVVLPPQAVLQAAGDLDGVGRGAHVQPRGCGTPDRVVGPNSAVMAVGADEATRATLTVELIRTDEPLAALRTRVTECRVVRVGRGGAVTVVTTQLYAPPRVEADDVMALHRTVRPPPGATGPVQSMWTLAGQVGDVRISATYMSFTGHEPDSEALDAVFSTAVAKVSEHR
ncbi:hypothetical protein [Nocardia sp. CNY236]|uniref:hypothetical protein n=1 Tax=Nocardia sp. CNY236 TaxID=1169152 RepID=UPI000684B4A9|nr:hypothetical protein [Nocardia sp. CNY236]